MCDLSPQCAAKRTSALGSWRLGAQQYSHDPLYLTGLVSEVERLTDSCRITVEVAGNNSRGLHANCTVRLLLPLA